MTLLLASNSTFAAKKVITLATSVWKPYVSDVGYKGYAYDLVEDAFKAAGFEVKIKFMPWKDAMAALKAGKVDGVFPKYYSTQDGQNLAFSQPFSGGPIALYKRRDNKAEFPIQNPPANLVETFDRMSDAKFGVVKGYTNVPAIDENPRLHKVTVLDDKANLEQLYERKVQFAVIDKYVAEHLLNHELPGSYARQLTFMPPILSYKLLYVAVSKNNPDHEAILQAFNRGLKIIKENGHLSQILQHDAQEEGSEIS